MTTARDVRDAEQVARNKALQSFEDARNLITHAPPRASNLAAYEHNMAMARALDSIGHGWMRVASVHDEYAVELEQAEQQRLRITDGLPADERPTLAEVVDESGWFPGKAGAA